MTRNPLSSTDVRDLNRARATLSQWERDAQEAERAGVDVTQLQEREHELREAVNRLWQVYGPATTGA